MDNGESLVTELRKGILKWYEFKKDAVILCVGNSSLMEMFLEQGVQAVYATVGGSAKAEFLQSHLHFFDFIVAINVLETCYEPVKMLERWKSMLKDDGVFILGADNRLGLRYFCGDKDPFTKQNYDGIENYKRQNHSDIRAMGGRCYAKYEMESMLDTAGFKERKFYSVLPNIDAAQLIYAENYLPNEELAMRYFPMYHNPDSAFLNEEQLYTSLIHNGMFHQMANSYLIECSEQRGFADADHVTLSMDRGPAQAFATIVKNNRQVEKRPLYPQGRIKLSQIQENAQDLKAHGVSVVEGEVKGNGYVMPYISAQIGNIYMQELLTQDKEKFIRQMDRFRDIIMRSSEHVGQNERGIILKKGYIDLVPINCFFLDNDFVFFDQEFYEENYPANAILFRTVSIIYDNDVTRENILPSAFFWERYDMQDNLSLWHEMSTRFTDKLRKQKELAVFNDTYVRNYRIVDYNRAKVNDDRAFYRNQFLETCFDSIGDKKIVVFGAGKYAHKFLAFYKEEYEIYRILDNNKAKWGLEFNGIRIESPEILLQMDPDEYKVIVCVQRYELICKQLMRMGVKNIGIYDANFIYPGRQKQLPAAESGSDGKAKKYHIGYIAGVFDLYHIGHLNMFRRAKEQCDYLIAGVVSDEYVSKHKGKEAFIPFEERIEMVRSCKYVDEAVAVPYLYGGTVEAYEKYHFDVQFSGSDYINDPWWLEQKQYLEDHGAALVFFPYTQQTSSTKIKALIEKGLV